MWELRTRTTTSCAELSQAPWAVEGRSVRVWLPAYSGGTSYHPGQSEMSAFLYPAKGADDASLIHSCHPESSGIRLPGLDGPAEASSAYCGMGWGWTTGHWRNTHECGRYSLPAGPRPGCGAGGGGCRAVVTKPRGFTFIHSFLGMNLC